MDTLYREMKSRNRWIIFKLPEFQSLPMFKIQHCKKKKLHLQTYKLCRLQVKLAALQRTMTHTLQYIYIYIYNTKNIKSPEKPICLYITKPVTAFLYSLPNFGAEHDLESDHYCCHQCRSHTADTMNDLQLRETLFPTSSVSTGCIYAEQCM